MPYETRAFRVATTGLPRRRSMLPVQEKTADDNRLWVVGTDEISVLGSLVRVVLNAASSRLLT